MAHYAILDFYNTVIDVIVGRDENDIHPDVRSWEGYYKGKHYGCKRTSYNTRGGVYYDSQTGLPHADQSKAFRKNYAGLGYTYDQQRDAFIPPKPETGNWVLNEQTCLWEEQA